MIAGEGVERRHHLADGCTDHADPHPVTSLRSTAARIRMHVVKMSAAARVAHVASALSCTDILVALYFDAARVAPETATDRRRDRIILSKGHASAAQYACLAERGFIPVSLLDAYAANDSPLGEHPALGTIPGIECSTGFLGHGLSIGTGLALAARLDARPTRVFVVMSDGECNEGSVWEGAMWAARQRLHNLAPLSTPTACRRRDAATTSRRSSRLPTSGAPSGGTSRRPTGTTSATSPPCSRSRRRART